MRVPWTARRSNQSILKEISPECSLHGLMLMLKLQYFGHLMQRTDSLEKTLMLGKIEDWRRRGLQRIFSNPGTEPGSPSLQVDSLLLVPPGKAHLSRINSVQSVTQSCPTLCNPMDCSTPGFPVHHQHPELAQTHVHQVSDVVQPSHPPSSPSPPVFNLSHHQGLFQ